MNICWRGDQRNPDRRREHQQRRVNEAVEELLLKLANRAFPLMRTALVWGLWSAGVAEGSDVWTIHRNAAMTAMILRHFDRHPVSDQKKEQAA